MQALRVLLLEDDAADAELIASALRRASPLSVTRTVSTRDAFVAALGEFAPDVILSDHALAQFNAPAAMEVVRSARPGTPVIVVSGAMDEHHTVACVRAGVEDVVLKSHLERLVPAVEAALAIRARIARLSPRQLQVMRLIAEGLTTREIAARLKVSEKTADTHRSAVMRRLEVHDLASVVRHAVRVGLVIAGAG